MSPLRLALLPAQLLSLLAGLFGGCAHTEARGTLAELRPVAEQFHLAVRWRDYHRAAAVLVEEQQEAFQAARRVARDERDLHITDFELEDAHLLLDGHQARVTSRLQWYRLPSLSEQRDTVVSHFVFRSGRWKLERQEGGPFAFTAEPAK